MYNEKLQTEIHSSNTSYMEHSGSDDNVLKKKNLSPAKPKFKTRRNISLKKSALLPKIKIKILPNLDKKFVQSLNFEEKFEDTFMRQKKTFVQKQLIDNNEEIKLKRMGLFIKKSFSYEDKKRDKLDSKEKERFLESEFKDQLNKYQKKENELLEIDNKIKELIAINEDNKLKLHTLKNYGEYFNKQFEADEELKDLDKTNKDENYKFERLNKLVKFKQNQEDKKEILIQEIEKKDIEIDKLKEEQNFLTLQCAELKAQWYQMRLRLIEHYHLALYEGLDFKGDGLVSLIKSIWNLGVDVDYTFMPTYLDQKAIDYLFDRAHHFIKISKLKILVDETKKEFLIDLKNWQDRCNKADKENNKNDDDEHYDNEESRTEEHFFKTGLMENKVDKYPKSTKFMENYEDNIIKHNESVDMKDLHKILDKQLIIPEDVLEKNVKTNKLKVMLNNLRKEMIENEKKEINRLAKEFTFNNYCKIYKVTPEIIIAALLGDDRKDEGLTYYSKLIKEFKDSKKIVKFYSTFDAETHKKNK